MWDQGTHQPTEGWPQALASLMKQVDADGVNGDTQDGVPLGFSLAADKIGHPLVFQPEGGPSDEALSWNVMTWGQYTFPFIPMVDRYKWLEPRHMVNISDRWNLHRFAYDACVLVQAAIFFRRDLFKQTDGFNDMNRTAWDMELWADLALAGARFHRFEEFLAVSRLHQASISCRLELRRQRRQDARAVRQKVKGRIETPGDRLYAIVERLRKFSGHPLRTLNQRLFFRSTLHRWTL